MKNSTGASKYQQLTAKVRAKTIFAGVGAASFLLAGCAPQIDKYVSVQTGAEMIDPVTNQSVIDPKTNAPMRFATNLYCWKDNSLGTRMCGLAINVDLVHRTITFGTLVPTTGPMRGAVDVGLGVFNAATNTLLVAAEFKAASGAVSSASSGDAGAPTTEINTSVRVGTVSGASGLVVAPSASGLGLH